MAKGFGPRKSEQLGYILILDPLHKVYAASFSLDEDLAFNSDSEEPFIGVTNKLDGAQVWKTKKKARQAISLYTEFFLDQLEEKTEVRIYLKCLKRSSDDELTEELVESMVVVPNGQGIDIITVGRHR